MKWLYRHWQQIGLVISALLMLTLAITYANIDGFRVLLIVSLITLLLHQFEEYQFPGGFPRMVNRVMFGSKNTENYPLNPRTAFIINVVIGWGSYTLAIIFGASAVWLATATIMVSIGNVLAHTLLFKIKGRTWYNPGMLTALVLFLPISIYYFVYISTHDMLRLGSLATGVLLGIALNYFGVFRMITLCAKPSTRHIFKQLR